jgi:hypothetical protein
LEPQQNVRRSAALPVPLTVEIHHMAVEASLASLPGQSADSAMRIFGS